MSGSPVVAEIVARVFPVVLIDCEHGSGGMGMDLLHLLQAVRSGGAEALVRVPRFTTADVTRALDGGAAGVVVPLVESAEDAQAVLAAARYPPTGRRGTAPMCIRASGWGLDAGYAARADSEALVLAQVETTKAMEKDVLEGMLASGVDGVFLGPADLAASAGHLGDVDHPEVFALRERLEKACAERGILLAGFAAGRRVNAADMLHKRGYGLVASAVDVVMLKDAAVDNLRASTAAAAGASARSSRRSSGY